MSSGTLADERALAISATPGNGSELSITPGCESDADDWFYNAAQQLLGKDAGLHLHYITGYPQSSCYAYVTKIKANRRRPPDHFLRKLFHADQGEPFHEAFMAGCKAKWWLERQRAAEGAAEGDRLLRGLLAEIERYQRARKLKQLEPVMRDG